MREEIGRIQRSIVYAKSILDKAEKSILQLQNFPEVKVGQVWEDDNKLGKYLICYDSEIGHKARLIMIKLPDSSGYCSQWFYGKGKTFEELTEMLINYGFNLVEDYKW